MNSACPTCLSSDLAWLLSQAHYTLANRVTAAIEPLGITMREFQVLKTAVQGSYTQKDLADLVGLDKTTMVATIDDLEEVREVLLRVAALHGGLGPGTRA